MRSHTSEIKFGKYQKRGAYHWEHISNSIGRHNAVVSARYDAILSALGDISGQRVLDIGGGDGVLSYLIAKRGGQPVTIDIEYLALGFAQQQFTRRELNAQTVQASAYTLPFPSGAFDAAVCSEVLEHVQLPAKLLAEAERILRPGGLFVLTTPLRVTENPLDRAHVREYFSSELTSLLTLVFDEVNVTPFAPLALVDLFGLPFESLGRRQLFRYLFNFCAIYLNQNPFKASSPFRYLSLLLATGRKKEG